MSAPAPPWRRAAYRAFRDRRVRYLLVGMGATVSYYAVFTTGWLLANGRIPYLAVAVAANLVTAGATYPLYRSGVFDAHPASVRGFLRFYVICLANLVATLVGVPLLVEVYALPVLAAPAVVIAVSPVINYQIHRLWSFRRCD